MKARTKIIATLGPSTEDVATIKALVNAGMNVARLNFSHGSYAQFKSIVKNLRTVEKETGKIVTIMQDLQGPKIRIGTLKEPIKVSKGQTITFSSKASEGIHIPYSELAKVVKKGEFLLIEDGLIRTKILSTKSDKVRAKVIEGGVIKSHKGVNIPDSTLPSSASLTAKDKKDLIFGVKTLKVDALAVSFVDSASDIARVRKEIKKHTKSQTPIIAKIERSNALVNLQEIIDESDGVMVARGDLGIETKAERVPIEQKRIIALARQQGKPVIIATQILQSMVENPLPTRAEMSDAAHAVFEHSDAFMLSNESAVGKYPIKAVKTLAKVAMSTEEAIFKDKELFPISNHSGNDPIEDAATALNACKIADEIDASAIVVLTKKGYTAKSILKHRPKTKIIVVTKNPRIAKFMNMHWGINDIVLYDGKFRSEEVLNYLKKKKILKNGQDVVSIKLSDKKRSLVMMKV